MDEDRTNSAKVSGYLEKKGKMKMMNSYKKYWFVLEGRLLLYYRSKDEYEAISPCKGSINLGPPCNVKPCSSQSGVFQIETRTNTITLKAENQEDQNRWMLGIMSALRQNTSSTKLSHFRYSLDELPQQNTSSEVLDSSNTRPQSSKTSECSSNISIIQRLQKIGGQSHGANMYKTSQVVKNIKVERADNINSGEPSQYKLVALKTIRDTEIKNDQQKAFKTHSISENINTAETDVILEHSIYEKIDDTIVLKKPKEVGYSVPNKINYKKGTLKKIQNSCVPYGETCNKNQHSFQLNNEVQRQQDIEGKDETNKIRQTSFVLENEHYYSVNKIISFPNTDAEMIYVEPKCTDVMDYNENSLAVLNRILGEENAYSINELYDTTRTRASPVEYEDLDKYVEYTEIKQPSEELYSECRSYTKSKSKAKKDKWGKQYKNNTDNDKKDVKLKKSSSFIRRMWKRKSKRKEREKNLENLYEVIPAAVVEKVAVSDDTAIQMLSELQNILENKKPVLYERLSEVCMNMNNEKNQTEHENQITPHVTVSDSSISHCTVEQLSELQNILKQKKAMISELISDDKHLPMESIKPTISNTEGTTENKMVRSGHSEVASSSSGSENSRPMLPIKQKTRTSHHDIPEPNEPFTKRLTSKSDQYCESFKSIDDILNDLNDENSEDITQNKVKRLIKQFSAPEFYENDVVLRNKRCHPKDATDSDELNRLLNELAKVTCAPILTPGVTSSLISPNLTDEELIKLLPQRHRRYSEPDYDIPRPHKSLINLPRKDEPSDIVIESTRFFGPILKPSEDNVLKSDMTSSEDVHLLSMTPDSLESSTHDGKFANMPRSTEDDKNSYTSHNYILSKNYSNGSIKNDFMSKKKPPEFENSMKVFDNIIIENDIYAQPKSLYNFDSIKESRINDVDHLILQKNNSLDVQIDDEKLPDVYIDSLEMYNSETSPAF